MWSGVPLFIPHSAFAIPHWGDEVISLSGRRAFVTGGGRGIGRATALLLARAGAVVAVGYRARGDEAGATLREIVAGGGRGTTVGGDLAVAAEVDRVVARVRSEIGGIDLLVVNHGVWPAVDVPLARMPPARWDETRRVNFDAVFFVCRAVIPHLPDGGRIVLVSSTAGQRGEAGHADYAATKGALIALTKSLAVELAPRVTVNGVAPGWVDTEMAREPYERDGGRGRREIERTIPLGRVAAPEDVAGPIVFLCSELARHITGEILNVNGGSVLCG